MKTILISIITVLLTLPCFGQSSWFPTGAKWHYEFSAFLGSGLTILEVVEDDTLMGNHSYKTILSTTIFEDPSGLTDTFTEVLRVYEEDQVVSGFDSFFGGITLYDFNASVGDTLDMFFGGLSPSPFVVDSIGEMEINGNLLAFQDIRFPRLYDTTLYDEIRVVEGIGSLSTHLFHSYTVIQPFDFPAYFLRCYEDENVGLINFSHNQVDCNYPYETTAISEHSKSTPSISPVPATDYIIIKSDSPIGKYLVVDPLGTIILSGQTWQAVELVVDITQLNPGLYFIVGLHENGKVQWTKRFTKLSN